MLVQRRQAHPILQVLQSEGGTWHYRCAEQILHAVSIPQHRRKVIMRKQRLQAL